MPLGPVHAIDYDLERAGVRLQPEHEAARKLAVRLVSLAVTEDAVGRIGEPYRAVGFHHKVVGGVEAVTLVVVGEGYDCAVVLGAADAAVAMLAAH